MTVIIGIDPHKATHTAVAIDQDEQRLGELKVTADRAQAQRLLAWAAPFEERAWAVESADGLGKLLSQQLVAEGEHVIDVPPTLAGSGCWARPKPARATRTTRCRPRSPVRHGGLRRVVADDDRVVLRLLVRRYGDVTAARTRAVCRLHAVLIELIPGGLPRKLKADQAAAALRKVRPDNPVDAARRALAVDFVAELRRHDRELKDLRRRIAAAVEESGTTLTEVFGVGPIVAGMIIGYAGDPARFRTRHEFASYNGTAPLEASSGPRARHRLNPRGNRKLNHAMHLIAVTQIRNAHSPGRAFYDRKLTEGKTKKEALRALKRRISDAVWRQFQVDIGRR